LSIGERAPCWHWSRGSKLTRQCSLRLADGDIVLDATLGVVLGGRLQSVLVRLSQPLARPVVLEARRLDLADAALCKTTVAMSAAYAKMPKACNISHPNKKQPGYSRGSAHIVEFASKMC